MNTTGHITKSGTHYWTYNDASLPTIIMIHGFRGTHHGLDLIAQKLPKYHMIVPDLPGFGASATLDYHGLSDYTLWLHTFIQNLQLTRTPVLLGHSFGSIIAAEYAAQYPTTIQKLILVNPIGSPALKGPKAVLTQLAVFYYALGRVLPRRLASAWLKSKAVVMIMSTTMAKTKDKKLRQYIHNQHLQHFSSFAHPKSVSEAFQTSTRHHVRQSAPRIHVPTLLIAGDKDDITPLAKQRELTSLFPSAALHVITDVGHLTHYETPQNVADAIDTFI